MRNTSCRRCKDRGLLKPPVARPEARSRGQKSRRWSAGRRRARGAFKFAQTAQACLRLARLPRATAAGTSGGAFRRSTPSLFREGCVKPGAVRRAATLPRASRTASSEDHERRNADDELRDDRKRASFTSPRVRGEVARRSHKRVYARLRRAMAKAGG